VTGADKRRAVFLDRDGVLLRAVVRHNRPYAPTTSEEVQIIDGVPAACSELSRLGFVLILVTNQPEVARGTLSRQFVDETNEFVKKTLGLDEVCVCDHDNADHCDCRKPKPGLITAAAERMSVDLPSSIVVGDRWRDIEAGKRAGCMTVFIDYRYDEKPPERPDHAASSLAAALPWIRARLGR